MHRYIVLSLGSNSSGQLALGHGEDRHYPEQTIFGQTSPTTSARLTDTTACIALRSRPCVVGGGNHSLMYEPGSDTYYASGSNVHGELGLVPAVGESIVKDDLALSWQSIIISEFDAGIAKMAAGWYHTLALDGKGRVYACGSNEHGQCGIGERGEATATTGPGRRSHGWIRVEFAGNGDDLVQIADIACGMRHSMAVAKDGRLYGWGANRHGQLGFKCSGSHSAGAGTVAGKGPEARVKSWSDARKMSVVWTPTEVPGISGVTKVACGRHHTACLLNSGEVWVAGDNKYGQQSGPYHKGESLRGDNSAVWRRVKLGGPAHSLASGWEHLVALVRMPPSSGSGPEFTAVVSWGRSDHGQLGGSLEGLVEDGREDPQVACGSAHTLALTSGGRVVAWGWNEHGNCGDPSLQNVHSPHEITIDGTKVPVESLQRKRMLLKPVTIGCGYGNSYIVCELIDVMQ
ncbi:hypothetical protein EV182_001681 [Spiromyces aspiralis]|uniref:Uncharacterized protein n=1 Tax=Spiromyces aspiralis TaxID=68401 RepID=A0ACC1HLP7_9FUNG|nr:hypothetical protein EV182_001681 [Spiromyces aspiralis]